METKQKNLANNPQKSPKSTIKYTNAEAVAHSLEYFKGDSLAANVFVNKYALKDSFGNIYEATPDDMHRRLARELARIENSYPNSMSENDLYNVLKDFKYIIPQGGPMSGIGNKFQVSSLSNCFVIGNEADSYGGIMKMDEEQVQLMKRRGGVGHDLSHIRPKGSPVKNSALTSTGIVPFMERYSNSTREVAQDGRRGALMLSLSMKHPDAEDFIDAKLDLGKITGANISVKIDDEFMQSVKSGVPYKQQYPIESNNPTFTKEVDASGIWNKITQNAWKSAEPGILFWDKIINESVSDCYADNGFKTLSTNPCGEIPLNPYDSCRLLAVNLYSYVDNPFTSDAKFDFELFSKHAGIAQRIMDDIIDIELEQIDKILDKITKDPEVDYIKRTEIELWEKIKYNAQQGRRTGIGITAEGDMLAAMNYTYGSDDAIVFSEKVHSELAINVYKSSVALAKERGPFLMYDSAKEVGNPFIERLKNLDSTFYDEMMHNGRRNVSLLTIAPTGSTSIMTQTSSGIEPVFMVAYKRRKKVNPNDKNTVVSFVDDNGDHWEEYHVFHHKFVIWLEANGYNMDEIKAMPDDELQEIVKKSPYHKATANDIDWVQKVKMQGKIQQYVDHSISVTVNIPKESTQDLVKDIFISAWENGCKGITIYRDGSREGVLIADTKKNDSKVFSDFHSPKRPTKLKAEILRFQNNHEKWIAVVGLLDDRPYEIFTGRAEDTFLLPKTLQSAFIVKVKDENGSNRYDIEFKDKDGYSGYYEGLSRSFDTAYWNYAKLISGVLRHGMPLKNVVELVTALHIDNEAINTWKKGIVRTLKKYIPDGTKVKEACENCEATDSLIYEEGCLICHECGHSKCG